MQRVAVPNVGRNLAGPFTPIAISPVAPVQRPSVIANIVNDITGRNNTQNDLQEEIVSKNRDRRAQERVRNAGRPDIFLSMQEIIGEEEFNAITTIVGVRTDRNIVNHKIALGDIFSEILDKRESVIGRINPLRIETDKKTTLAQDDFYGVVLVLDNVDREAAPGRVDVKDLGSNLTYNLKADNGSIVCLIWCTRPESQVSYTPELGVHATLSNESFKWSIAQGAIEITSTGMTGEAYPIIASADVMEALADVLSNVDSSMDIISERIIQMLS